jgi:hypothetical protein
MRHALIDQGQKREVIIEEALLLQKTLLLSSKYQELPWENKQILLRFGGSDANYLQKNISILSET